MEITGKIALVTGAASGIGRATARALAAEGAMVVVADIDAAGGKATEAELRDSGADARFVSADISTPAGVERLFQTVEDECGGLDIVINNAGIPTGNTPGWPDASLEKIHLVVSVNASAVMMGTRQAVQALRKRGGGAVVNTASIAGLGPPNPFDPIYSGSKAAVILFTQCCAMLAQTENVRVNAVLPGTVDTPILAKTGDGENPPDFLKEALESIQLISPEVVAAGIVDLVRDDTKAGETVVIDPEGAASPPG